MSKFIVRFFILFVLLGSLDLASANTCSDYNYFPATFSESVRPTVMIGLDESGSMGWYSYYDSFSSYTDVEGIFDPDLTYTYTNLGNKNYVWEINRSATASSCDTGLYADSHPSSTGLTYSGKCLNWNFMRRVDIFQWAMTGGVPNAHNSSNDNDPLKACDGQASCYVEIYHPDSNNGNGVGAFVEVLMDDPTNEHGIKDSILAKLMEKENQPRIGMMSYGGSLPNSYVKGSKGVYVGDFTAPTTDADYPFTNVSTAVNNLDPDGSTPSGAVLWDIWNYYKQEASEYGGISPNTGGINNAWKDPAYVCTSGGNCQWAPCASNYVILVSDGQWNTPTGNIVDSYCSDTDSDTCRSSDPVVAAYKMHKGANRNDGVFTDVEAVYTLGVYLSGTGEQSLKNVSMYGAFDLDAGDWPGGTTGFPDDTCVMDDYGNGSGSACEALPSSHDDWDAVNNTTRVPGADGLPDTFFSSQNAREMKDQLIAIFDDILKRASSGTSVATVSTQRRESSMMFQTYYYPSKENVSGEKYYWTGRVRAFFVDEKDNMREDSNLDDVLNAVEDEFLIFRYVTGEDSTKAYKISDSNADQIPDVCDLSTLTGDPLDSVNAIWDGAETLKVRIPTDRKIIYNKNFSTGQALSSANLTTSNAADLNAYWNFDNVTFAEKMVKFLQGYDNPDGDTSFRIRSFTSGTNSDYTQAYKLGDVINSSPRIIPNSAINHYNVVYQDMTYLNYVTSTKVKDRPQVLAVGANDGMLHGFSAGTIQKYSGGKDDISKVTGTDPGKELWAFMPQNAIAYLQWYHEEGPECHVPKVDYRFYLLDASIGGLHDDTKDKDSWKTLLVGQMGFGGKAIDVDGDGTDDYSSSIFVLDVTDPENPIFMWEVVLDDQTLTTSAPAILRKGDEAHEGKWYIAVGSGPTSPYATSFTPDPKVYIFNLRDGSKNVVSTGITDLALGDMIAVDADFDYTTDAVYFGSYGETATTDGGLYRLELKSGSTHLEMSALSDGQVSKILNTDAPVFGSPEAALDDNNKLWIFAGTGRFFNTDDKVDTTQQYIYGIVDLDDTWEDASSFPELTRSDLFDANDFEVEAAIKKVECTCNGVFTGKNASFNGSDYVCCGGSCTDQEPVVTEVANAVIAGSPSDNGISVEALADRITCDSGGDCKDLDGWFVSFDSKERSFSKPFIAGGILDVMTYVPNNDICSSGGTSNLSALYYKSGTPGFQPMFLSSSGSYDEASDGSTTKITSKLSLGAGAPPLGEAITALSPQEGTDKFTKMIQTSTGAILRQRQQAEGLSNKRLFQITR